MTRPLLLGESPGRARTNPSPLYPNPPGCTGHRLMKLAGMHVGEYLQRFDRMNLLPLSSVWSVPLARVQASQLLRGGLLRKRATVLLGRQVCAAFGQSKLEPLGLWEPAPGVLLYHVPHPSGRNRWYQDPANRDKAGALLRALACG